MDSDRKTLQQVESPPPSMLVPQDAAVQGPPISADALHDLGLEPIRLSIAGRLVPRLADVVITPLTTADAVHFRQEVFADLGKAETLEAVTGFTRDLRRVGDLQRSRNRTMYPQTTDIWDVHIVVIYLAAVDGLRDALESLTQTAALGSRALAGLHRYVTGVTNSAEYLRLRQWSAEVEAALDELRYAVWIRGSKVVVGHPGPEPDLQERVLDLFARFRTDPMPTESTLVSRLDEGIDHVQETILALNKQLNPQVFTQVHGLAALARDLVPDPGLMAAAEELEFYLAYRDLVAPCEAIGLRLCLPEIYETGAELMALDTWDLPLGVTLAGDSRVPVVNDLQLHDVERILVISGPNQGGKTTMARTFGQLFHLAAIGCPVPGSRVRIMLADRVLTVFEREETADEFNGRLGSELRRWHQVLEQATPRSAIVLNEIFSSTPLQDALLLGRTLIGQVIEIGAPAVLVTFMDELSRLAPQTVSMVSAVDPERPAERTFKVVRRRADGRAFAIALAERYRLGYHQIVGRIGS